MYVPFELFLPKAFISLHFWARNVTALCDSLPPVVDENDYLMNFRSNL